MVSPPQAQLWPSQPYSLFLTVHASRTGGHLLHAFLLPLLAAQIAGKTMQRWPSNPWSSYPTPWWLGHQAYATTLGFTQCWASVSGLWSELGRCTTYQWPTASAAKMDCSIFLVRKGPTLWILSLSVDRVWRARFWRLSHPHAYTVDTLINITLSSALTFMSFIYILIHF